jgi:phage gp36-like protein
MAYATKAEMILRFGERELVDLTDRELPMKQSIVDAVLDRAIGDAGAEIESYVSSRYPLPLPAPAPAILVRLCCDIARYYLYFYTAKIPEAVRKAYEDSIAFLKSVSRGDAVLAVTPPAPAPEETSSMAGSSSAEVFTPEVWSKY